jgi:DNA polymerase-1
MARRCHILSGLRSRYLDAYPRLVSPGGVLRYSLHQLRGDEGGTISGRFSCSQAIRGEEGANLQQVITSEKLHDQGIEEYDIRRLFVAPPGRIVVAGDAKQIEYRVFAHFTDNPVLLDAYRTDPDVDFHEWVGKDVRKLRPDFGRKRIKVTNFRVLFGGGVRSTCEALGVSEKEGRQLLDAYDKAFPDAKRLLRLASNLAENRRYVVTYLGRRSRFGPNDRYHKALNAVIQGTAADYNKVKLAALYRARRDFDLTLRLTVHDEVVGDVPNVEAANGLAAFLDRQEWPDFKVPILWSVGTGASWGEAK